jgi:hypothetical protein
MVYRAEFRSFKAVTALVLVIIAMVFVVAPIARDARLVLVGVCIAAALLWVRFRVRLVLAEDYFEYVGPLFRRRVKWAACYVRRMAHKSGASFAGLAMLAWAVTAALACSAQRSVARPPQRPAGSPGAEAVRAFAQRAQAPPAICADLECLAAAHRTCTSARFSRAYWTMEGTAAFQDFFVLQGGEGCTVVVFSDFTQDYWGGCRVAKDTCPNVEAATSDNGDTMGCSQETLFTASPCDIQRE